MIILMSVLWLWYLLIFYNVPYLLYQSIAIFALMQLSLKLDIPPLKKPINYTSCVLLTGSCFSEHISERLEQHKFKVVSNPNGILFNPISVADSLNGYLDNRQYAAGELFYLNELWNSWGHHTRFSDISEAAALTKINDAQKAGAEAIKNAGWVIITLGSAFQYYLVETGKAVANNHRAPAQWFEKKLLPVSAIIQALSNTINKLQYVNPGAQVLFTISPVRHIRDGVVENNRSKARLIEAVHELCGSFEQVHYFPAYELLIDILRDYRFYDIDFVHPNFLATSYVWEQFVKACINPADQKIMEQVYEIVTAAKHRPRFPETQAHHKFLLSFAQKCSYLLMEYPHINLQKEMAYFYS